MNLLVAVPVKNSLHDALRARMRALTDTERLTRNNPIFDSIEPAYHYNNACKTPSEDAFAPHARARNALLDTYLRDEHDFVLWIDADLVDWPANLPTLLYESVVRLRFDAPYRYDVVAPMVLIEDTDLFYDTYGFRDSDGQRLRRHAPYFADAAGARVTPMMSVGCAYLIRADIYRNGVRYEPTPAQTEHWSVMNAVRKRGGHVGVVRDVVAYHAHLPKYGEAYHGH